MYVINSATQNHDIVLDALRFAFSTLEEQQKLTLCYAAKRKLLYLRELSPG